MSSELILIPAEKKERADAQRNRQRLVEVATRLFQEQGVANVTMSAVAECAQVGKGTLYRHFPDKSALIIALLDTDMHDLQTRVFDRLRQPDAPQAKLAWFLEEAAHFVLDHLPFLLESADARPEAMRLHPAHEWWRQTIYGLLQQMGGGDDPDIIADVLYLLLDVQTIRYQLQARHYTRERILVGLRYTLTQLTR